MTSINSIKKIAIEGNIATGKSTFIKFLDVEIPFCTIIPEPIMKWTKTKELTSSQQSGKNLLELFYKDPKRYAYTFESYTAMCRMKDVRKHTENPVEGCRIQIYERSVFSSRHVFAKNSFESGLMSETEWNMYKDWSSSLITNSDSLKLDGIIYLRCNPEVSFKRMVTRGRSEENSVSLEYLKSIHEKHEEWLMPLSDEEEFVDNFHGFPVLVLDCNPEFQSDDVVRQSLIKKVKEFLTSIKT